MTQQTSQNSGFSHIIGGNEDQFLPHNHVSLRNTSTHVHVCLVVWECSFTARLGQCIFLFGNVGV